jgi:hypothetical protein
MRRVQIFTIQEMSGMIWSILYNSQGISTDCCPEVHLLQRRWRPDGMTAAALGFMFASSLGCFIGLRP